MQYSLSDQEVLLYYGQSGQYYFKLGVWATTAEMADLASASSERPPLRERWDWNYDSGRLSLRINPAQRGVVRSSLPYLSQGYNTALGSCWSMAFSIHSASASNSLSTQ